MLTTVPPSVIYDRNITRIHYQPIGDLKQYPLPPTTKYLIETKHGSAYLHTKNNQVH